MDIAHAFSRTEMLIGTEGLERLEQSHVAVFGAGGVGSHCIEALARSGVGTLSLIDHDTVSLTNINRQSMAFFSTIGRRKTEVLKERIADIAPDCRVYTWETFVLPENVNALMEEIRERAGGPPDYIIDAIDTVAAKIALAQYGDRTKILLIASMGTGNKLHPELFQIGDLFSTSVCPLCRVMRRELKKRGVTSLKVLYSKEEPLTPSGLWQGDSQDDSRSDSLRNGQGDAQDAALSDAQSSVQGRRRSTPGSISFVPPVAGLLIAGEVIRTLAGV